MSTVSAVRRAMALTVLGALLVPAGASGVPGTLQQAGAHALLDVPYVSQTPELCGGAAVAMVLRYWGERDVVAQDFAPLVGAGTGGIVTGTLASAVRARGWQALVLSASDGTARTTLSMQIDRGRPVIALIEVAPQTYHYVVIVGSTDRDVVLHDPAHSPFRVLRWEDFDRAWAATRQWMMVVLPSETSRPANPAPPTAPSVPAEEDPAAGTPCRAMVQRSVQLALAGDGAGAERGLGAAAALCPNDAAPWRELAGLRFTQSRWAESLELALAAVRLAPADAYSWQLVATSRYLTGDASGALGAWNRTGEPRIDTIDIQGITTTRQPVVLRAAGLQPRQLLTPEAFQRALRRLRAVPVASTVRLTYEPLDGGLARVQVFVDERRAWPRGWMGWGALATKAVLSREARVEVPGPTGSGELASAAWRWEPGRPRVALGLALPSPQWFSGIVSAEGSWERQSYGVRRASGDATTVREERRRVGLQAADWSTNWLRWQVGAAADRLPEPGHPTDARTGLRDHVALESSFDVRLAGDRLAVVISGGWWAPVGAGQPFTAAGVLATWRSTTDVMRPWWSVVGEYGVASRMAPRALWYGAGTGHGRQALLRAHPLLDHGVVTGPVFGREV
ncbi:MAG: C39 family peptidase, partial [Vicinamibacterales bacterium]|nr:C39 family peptidase [Vicinamibacterales bacterium]